MITINENDERFYIKNSSLKNAGLGLFAKKNIKKGDWIEVVGIMVVNDSAADFCTAYANRYKFASSKGDKRIIPIGYSAIINHTEDKTAQNVEIRCLKGLNKKNNDASEIVYLFLRDVDKDEEILGHYGEMASKEIKKMGVVDETFYEFVDYNLYNLKNIVNQITSAQS